MTQKKISEIVRRFQQMGINVSTVSPRAKIIALLIKEEKHRDHHQSNYLYEFY